jgi:ABC-type nitrate/sulfonate/bicarbonate transport system permease component
MPKIELMSLRWKVFSLIVALAIWEAVGRLTNPLFLSTPLLTFYALSDMVVNGLIQPRIVTTLRTFLLGLAISVAAGIPIGIVVGYFKRVRLSTEHFITALYSTPYVAWTGLIILWFGIGEEARTVMVVMASIWPMVINTMYGVAYIDDSFLEVGKAFGCNSRQMLQKIILPGSVPFIASGFRLAVGRAIVGALVAEMFLQLVGLGGMIVRYSDLLKADYVLALIIVVMFLGLALTELGKWAERKAGAWKIQIPT